jgi:pimeloyl-ACP methyl ester carboxylesterase
MTADSRRDTAEALLRVRGAAAIDHPGGSLLAHLRRVQTVLAEWGADEEVQLAGLCHAAYGTDGFGVALFALNERPVLAEAIRPEAEALAYLYASCDREKTYPQLAESVVTFTDRFNGGRHVPPQSDLRAFMEITAANELDVIDHDPELADQHGLALAALFGTARQHLSESAQKAWAAFATDRDANVQPIAVVRRGSGPEVLLVHGGASTATTWSGLELLSSCWTLAYVHRRGFAPSPPPPGKGQDFDVDADDLAVLLDDCPHIVAHSYGALGAVIAATRRPAQVRSLTLIEPPFFLPLDDPEVTRFRRMGDAVLAHGMQTDPAVLREFLRASGASVPDEGPLPEAVARGVRRAHGGRSPGEAELAFDVIRDAGIPAVVASGQHTVAVERMCDATAEQLRAQRILAPGAGHFVATAPGFADQLDRFLGALT